MSIIETLRANESSIIAAYESGVSTCELDATIFLPRKRAKYLEFLSSYDSVAA